MKYPICVCSVPKMRIFLPLGQFSQEAGCSAREDGGLHSRSPSSPLGEAGPPVTAGGMPAPPPRDPHRPSLQPEPALPTQPKPQGSVSFSIRSYYSSPDSDSDFSSLLHPNHILYKSGTFYLLQPSYHPQGPSDHLYSWNRSPWS